MFIIEKRAHKDARVLDLISPNHPFKEELLKTGIFNIDRKELEDFPEGARMTFKESYYYAFDFYCDTEHFKEHTGKICWDLYDQIRDGVPEMGVRANEKIANYWLGVACLYGHPEAMNFFISFAVGQLPGLDDIRRMEMHTIAFNDGKGSVFSGLNLAQRYAFSPKKEICDPFKAINILYKILNMDVRKEIKSKATAYLGYMHETGLGRGINFQEAFNRYKEETTFDKEGNGSFSLFFYSAFLLLGVGMADYNKKQAYKLLEEGISRDQYAPSPHWFHTSRDIEIIEEGRQKLEEWYDDGKRNEIQRFELAVLRMALRYERGAFGIEKVDMERAREYYNMLDPSKYEFVRTRLEELRPKRWSQDLRSAQQQLQNLSLKNQSAAAKTDFIERRQNYILNRQNVLYKVVEPDIFIQNDEFSNNESLQCFHRAMICSYYRILGKGLVGGDELQRNENAALDKVATGTNLVGKLASSLLPGVDIFTEIASAGLKYTANIAAVEAGQQLAQCAGLGGDIEKMVKKISNEITTKCLTALYNPVLKNGQKLYAGLKASDYILETLCDTIKKTGKRPDNAQIVSEVLDKIQKNKLLVLSKEANTKNKIKVGVGKKIKGFKRRLVRLA